MDFLSFDPRLTQWAQSGNVKELTAYIQNTPNLWETFHAYNDCSQLFPPLQTAVEAGQLECVKAFEPLVATKSWNEIFERAFEYNHYDMAQWLISKLTPQLIEDWSCAFASKGNLRAIETTLPYLSEQGKQMVLYYAASTQHDSVVDYLEGEIDVNAPLEESKMETDMFFPSQT